MPQTGRYRLSDIDRPPPTGRYRIADIDPPEPREERPSLLRRAWDAANRPLLPVLADVAHAAEEKIAAPSSLADRFDALMRMALPGTRRGQARGFIAGAAGGAGDVAAGFTSPLGVATTMAGVGAERSALAALPRLARNLRIAEGAAGSAFAGQGAHQIATAPDLPSALAGVATLAGGAAGAAHAGTGRRATPARATRGPDLTEVVRPSAGRFRIEDIEPARPTPSVTDVTPDTSVTSAAAPALVPAARNRLAEAHAKPAPVKFDELPAIEKQEFRRILAELDEFRFEQPGRPKVRINAGELEPESPLATARTPNAPIYQALTAEKKRSGRELREKGLAYEGGGKPSAIAIDILRAAQRRAYDDPHWLEALGGEVGLKPGEIVVPRKRWNTPDEALEDQVATAVERTPQAFLEAYRQRFGKVISNDSAHELFDVYSKSPDARRATQRATRSPANTLVERLYDEALAAPLKPGTEPEIVFTAGGTGSGKSTLLRDQPEVQTAHAMFDSTLSDYAASKRKIARARATDHAVTISYLFRDPVDAYVQGVVSRVLDPAQGRTVSIDVHARTHVNAITNVLKLAEERADDLYTSVIVRENPAGGLVAVRDLDWLRAHQERYNDPDVLATRIRAALAADVDAGRLSPETVATVTGEAPGVRGGPQPPRATEPLAEPRGRYELDPATGHAREVVAEPIGSPTRALYDTAARSPDLGDIVGGRPVSEPQVVERLQRIFARRQPANVLEQVAFGAPTRDLPVRTGRYAQRAFGVYFPEPALVRLKRSGDLTTFTHELGHHIDFGVFKEVGRPQGLFKDELLTLGAETTPPSKVGSDYHLAEGVAEYFRTWFAKPAEAERVAPNFTAALEAVMEAAPPFRQQLTEAQGLVQRYLAQPAAVRGAARVNVRPLGATGRAKDVLAELQSNQERGGFVGRFTAALRDTDSLPAPLENRRAWWDRQVTRFVDRHQAIWRALQDYAPKLPASMNAYTLVRLADKSPAMAEGFLKVGPRGKDGTFLGPGLEAVLRPVHDRLYPDPANPARPSLVTYLVALRARELVLEGKGRLPGMRNDEWQAIIERTEADPDFSRLAQARDGVYGFLKGLRRYALDYGALSGEQVAQLEQAAFYVPLQRVVTEGDVGVRPGGAKYADRQSPLKRLKGSGKDVVDPIESIVRNTFALTAFVERNRAAKALADTLGHREGAGALLQEIAAPQEATRFGLQQVQDEVLQALIAAGVVDAGEVTAMRMTGALDDAFNQLVTVYTPTAFGKPGERILFVMDHGKRRFFQIQDEALYENLVALGPGPTNQLLEVAGKAASLLRAGVTMRPTFVVRNLLRDTLGAMFQSRHGFLPIYDTARGLLSQLKEDVDYQRFMAWGVQQATLLGNDRNALRSALDRATTPTSWPSKAFRPIRHPVQFLQEFSQAIETATRLGELKLALDTGGKERRAGVLGWAQRAADVGKARPPVTEEIMTKAALAAADVTVDFTRGGVWTKNLSTVAAFLNARTQGFVRGVETVQRDPVGVALTASSLAAFSSLLWWWNKDDEKYQQLDPQRKRDYWYIRLPGTEHWLTVAKPFVWSSVANITEAALEETRRNAPEALHPLRDFAGAQGRELVLTLAPTLVMPTLEALSNFDFYRNRAIVPHWQKDREPDLQVTDWTSDTFRVMGHALGVSPAVLEHWTTKTAGSAVTDLTSITDPLARQALNRTRPPGPSRGVERVPGVQALVQPRRIDSRAASVEEFYDRWTEIENAKASLKSYAKGGGQTEAKAYLERLRATWPAGFVDRMTRAKKSIDQMNDAEDAIRGGRLDPAEKRRRLDKLNELRARAARWGLEGRVQ